MIPQPTKPMTKAEAKKFLTSHGMVKNYSSRPDRREYWWFENKENYFLDHSATITGPVNGLYYVSVFDPEEKKAA